MDFPEDSKLTCSCGLSAKLRISRTTRNPYRMFYNCLKYQKNDQCKFFQWCDEPLLTGDKHLDELNLIRSECIRLHERINDIQEEWDNERTQWNSERKELISELSTRKAELDELKNKIELVNESHCNASSIGQITQKDEDVDNALVVQTL